MESLRPPCGLGASILSANEAADTRVSRPWAGEPLKPWTVGRLDTMDGAGAAFNLELVDTESSSSLAIGWRGLEFGWVDPIWQLGCASL
jgi:hypothetical protein